MQTITIGDHQDMSLIQELNLAIKGDLKRTNFEETLVFDTNFGIGHIKVMTFSWGVPLLHLDVNFSRDTKLVCKYANDHKVEFLYLLMGSLHHSNTNKQEIKRVEQFQNVIVSKKAGDRSSYLFPERTKVKLNMILINGQEFLKKPSIHKHKFNHKIVSVLNGNDAHLSFEHFGNYNLQMASVISQIDRFQGDELIRYLSIEGQVNILLGMHLLEHDKFESSVSIHNFLSHEDINKIQELSNFIKTNLGWYGLTVRDLVEESGIGPKKLQMGFRLLYSKSINEYIRHLKMETARHLIESTDETISEIVYQIGYKSRSYFSKLFFENYQLLPTEYRDLLKKSN